MIRKETLGWFLAVIAISLMLVTHEVEAETLRIRPVIQQTQVWCWVAVSEMVFRYYDIPNVNPVGNFQCGIVGLLAAGSWANACAYRCELCSVPAGSAQALIEALEIYPRRAAEVTGRRVAELEVDYRPRALRPNELADAIDAGVPIVAGISPSGRPAGASASQHVAVIVGYRQLRDRFELRVHDPFPFVGWRGNPYLVAGARSAGQNSYWIDYADFQHRLGWAESFAVERVGTIQPPRLASKCCFQTYQGPAWCSLNLSGSLPEGTSCTCNYGYGRVYAGQACD